MDRFAQFGLAAALQAVSDAGLVISESIKDRMGVILGTGIGGMKSLYEQVIIFFSRGVERISPFLVPMMLPDSAAGMIALRLGLHGPNMAVVSACASGTNALGEAAEVIRRGRADVIVSGGTEAVIVPIAMSGLTVMGALSLHNDEPE
jgi:3-oxoacyl-[acyl-carrier-protein] synthase II